MAPRHFRRYFRMYTDTLNSIISYLALREPFTTLLEEGRICRHKKVTMTCAYLGKKQGGVHDVIIMLFTFVNIFIKCHEIDWQNKLLIIKSLTFEHCQQLFRILEYTFLRCTDVVMDGMIANLSQIIRWPKIIWIWKIWLWIWDSWTLLPNLNLLSSTTSSFLHYLLK